MGHHEKGWERRTLDKLLNVYISILAENFFGGITEMNGLLQGRKVFITGTRGTAEAIIALAAKEGADVAFTWLTDGGKEAAHRHLEKLKDAGVKAYAYPLDLRNVREIREVVRRVKNDLGRIDGLINCAGVYIYNAAEKTTEDQWDLNIDTDLKGAFFLSQEVANQAMIPQKGGRIVHISSFVATLPVSNLAAYNIGKAGVNLLAQQLAFEWAKYGIQVNTVSPGYIGTEPLLAAIKKGDVDGDAIIRNCPMGRLTKMEEVAEACVYLVSKRCPDFLTGSNLFVDGGYRAGIRFTTINWDDRKVTVW